MRFFFYGVLWGWNDMAFIWYCYENHISNVIENKIKKPIVYNKCFLWLRHNPEKVNGKGYICTRCGKTELECR